MLGANGFSSGWTSDMKDGNQFYGENYAVCSERHKLGAEQNGGYYGYL